MASIVRASSAVGLQNPEFETFAGLDEALRRVLEVGQAWPAANAELSTERPEGNTLTGRGTRSSTLPEQHLASDDPSERIGPYQLLEPIGSGGMGLVYRARHVHLGRDVAIKVLPAEKTGSEQVSRRFEREMQAVGKLDHPNIVSGLDAGEFGGRFYLAMELLRGVDLSTIAKMNPVRARYGDFCEIMRQAATGLQYAHQNGVIHRDVKPSNIMLCALTGNQPRDPVADADRDPASDNAPFTNTVVKLLDLGLARIEHDDPSRTSMTAVDQIMGTIDYMSPEQCLDSRQVDARSDIYSMGATMYRLFTGLAPWSGPEFTTQGQKLNALLSQQVPSIAERCADLPAGLVAIVDRALQRDPADRFQTAEEFIAALIPFTNGHDLPALLMDSTKYLWPTESGLRSPVESRPVSFLAVPAVTKPDFGYSTDRQEPARIAPPRHRTRWMLLASLPVLALMMGIIWLKTDGGYIRIESDSAENVSVEILKNGSVVDQVSVGRGDNKFWYRSGQYEIRLADNRDANLVIEGDKLTLLRNGKPVVTISQLTDDGKNAESGQPEINAGQPERPRSPAAESGPQAIARWVLSNSGDLATDFGVIRSEAEIPPGDFEIHAIGLGNAGDEEVAKVCAMMGNLPKCNRLYLNGGPTRRITGRSLPHVGRLTGLNSLGLERCNIADSEFLQTGPMPALHELRLNQLRITGKTVEHVARTFPQLVVLGIDSKSLDGADLQPLAAMNELRVLDLTLSHVTAKLLEPLEPSGIYRVCFRGVEIFEAGSCEQLARFNALEEIHVQNSRFGEKELIALTGLETLKILELDNTTIPVDAMVRFLEQRPEIEVMLEYAKSPLLELKHLPQIKDRSIR